MPPDLKCLQLASISPAVSFERAVCQSSAFNKFFFWRLIVSQAVVCERAAPVGSRAAIEAFGVGGDGLGKSAAES